MEPKEKDRPWIFRTYAGYATPAATNARFKANLAKGQTGLSVAFDLPTQTGYDSDHVMAKGEVGRVGVPISHLGDMRTVFDGIPIADINTSMTINATAVWLLALYVAKVKARRYFPDDGFPHLFGRISFFCTSRNRTIKQLAYISNINAFLVR